MRDPFQKPCLTRLFTSPKFYIGTGTALALVGLATCASSGLTAHIACLKLGLALSMMPVIAAKILFAGLLVTAVGSAMLIAGLLYMCHQNRIRQSQHHPITGAGVKARYGANTDDSGSETLQTGLN